MNENFVLYGCPICGETIKELMIVTCEANKTHIHNDENGHPRIYEFKLLTFKED